MYSILAKYSGFAENSLKERYTYRVRALIWLMYDIVMFLIQYYLWSAIFEANNDSMCGLKLNQYMWYLGAFFLSRRIVYSLVDDRMYTDIREGNVAVSLPSPTATWP